jgi:hypothetical protein
MPLKSNAIKQKQFFFVSLSSVLCTMYLSSILADQQRPRICAMHIEKETYAVVWAFIGCVVSVYSCADRAQLNFDDLTPYI